MKQNDPQVLAQASIDWTKGALESQDWAVRKAAAGVLAAAFEPLISDSIPCTWPVFCMH